MDHGFKLFKLSKTSLLLIVTLLLSACGSDSGSGQTETTPDAFTFVDKTNVARSTWIESNGVTLTGFNDAAAVTVQGGEYSIEGGALEVTWLIFRSLLWGKVQLQLWPRLI